MKKYFYLINLQFIGFRYSGWQKQTNAKTIQGMVDKTFFCIFGHEKFKTLGAGRTDAKVSANQYAFQLFLEEEVDEIELLKELNKNLPPDIRALDISEVDKNFKILNDPKIKEYMYMFTYGEQMHPFCAPFMVCFPYTLDIELMKQGAKLFMGKHNFQQYCYKPNENTEFIRTVDFCEIVNNDIYYANFFPEISLVFHVHGKGFMRQQIRLMMGALVRLGRGEISLNDIKISLEGGEAKTAGFIVPSSGLILNRVRFE
jgi:tRNA pseudouridine38-40 synthase